MCILMAPTVTDGATEGDSGMSQLRVMTLSN